MFELFNEKHQKISNDIFEYAKTNFLSVRDKIESEEIIPPAIYRNMANLGWYGIAIPEIHQGMGASHLSRFLAIEQVSRISGAIGGALQSAILGTAMVQYYGSNKQQKKWLPRFATGDDVISICITEPDSGSHILGMNTIAQRDGDDYVLNGMKCWIANSHIATVHGVIARTSEGSNGLSAFLVEKDRVGVRPGRANDNTGLRGFNLGEVIFENCRVPVINRIGVEGMGLEIAHKSITCYGKTNLAAVALGIHQAILDAALVYVRERSIYGRPLSELESVRLKLGAVYKNVSLARQTAYLAMNELDRTGSADESIILAKLVGTELAFESAKITMDIFAARGTSRSIPIERYLRDLLMVFPPAGTSDIHQKRLAEIALGNYVKKNTSPKFLRQIAEMA